MEYSNQLIKKTKRKFVLYSLLGMLLVSIISFTALRLHSKNVEKQTSIQEVNSLIMGQLNLLNKISLLSEQFDDKKTPQDSVDLFFEFKVLVSDLESKLNKFNHWIKDHESPSLKNFKKILIKDQVDVKMSLFLGKAKDLLSSGVISNLQMKTNIKFLSESSREGVGADLTLISEKLQGEQVESLSIFNKMGFALVGLCVLQIVLVWVLVFNPLNNTILYQNQKISEEILRAESASRSKTDFLANISHEIRTPMTAILGYADILNRDNISQAEKKDAVKIIDQNANHLLSLIDEILDISKIEAGKFDFENQELELSPFLNEVYSLINVKSEDKGIELIFKNDGKIPEKILADPKRLKQILFNLLGNAIKFTHKGYVKLIVSYKEKKNMLSLVIEDSGIGISPEQIDKLFKPFEQADTSVSRRFGGTGLGLVLSKGLAKGMGGDVNVIESKVDVGTSMEVLIDIGEPSNLDLVSSFSTNIIESTPSEIKVSQLQNIKILVVDDAKENARLFKIYLQEAGADVEIANDGESAINIVDKQSFDIILLDLQMPGKDGFKVIQEIREKSYKMPIVALTAHAMKEEKEKTHKAGFDEHITKPVKADVLISTILMVLESKKLS